MYLILSHCYPWIYWPPRCKPYILLFLMLFELLDLDHPLEYDPFLNSGNISTFHSCTPKSETSYRCCIVEFALISHPELVSLCMKIHLDSIID